MTCVPQLENDLCPPPPLTPQLENDLCPQLIYGAKYICKYLVINNDSTIFFVAIYSTNFMWEGWGGCSLMPHPPKAILPLNSYVYQQENLCLLFPLLATLPHH